MSRMFQELISNSRRISRDEFARTFGGVADEVVDMLTSDKAISTLDEARGYMEQTANPLPNGMLRLTKMEFGLFSTAQELERGEVAAVDGTPALPLQIYSPGQAVCVGIGSLSHRRPLQDSIHFWSSKLELEKAENTADFLNKQTEGIYNISQTAYMRYFEAKHAQEIQEEYIIFDGPIIYEWLVGLKEGVTLYENLLATKKCIGIRKNIKASVETATFARALRTGEVFIQGTLKDLFEKSMASNHNWGESAKRGVLSQFMDTADKIYRGIFKPSKKAFGFEVHSDHMADMLRIMAADCQLNNVGHEIPYLLNRVDEEVRTNFRASILKDRIAATLAKESEELFFEEADERDLR